MKRKVLFLSCCLLLSSCDALVNFNLDSTEVTVTNGTTISWNAVDKANIYKIFNTDNQLLAETKDLNYHFTDFVEPFDVYVKPAFDIELMNVGINNNSNIVTISKQKLVAPTTSSVDNVLTWNEIYDAEFYEVYDSNTLELLDTTEETSYVLNESEVDISAYVVACYNNESLKPLNSDPSEVKTLLKDIETVDLSTLDSNYLIESYVKTITLFGSKSGVSIFIEDRTTDININLNNVMLYGSSDGPTMAFEHYDTNDNNVHLNVLSTSTLSGKYSLSQKTYPSIEAKNISINVSQNEKFIANGGASTSIDGSYNGAPAIIANSIKIVGDVELYGGKGNSPTSRSALDGGNGASPILATEITFKDSNAKLIAGDGGNGSNGYSGSTGVSGWDSTAARNGGNGGDGGDGGDGGLSICLNATYSLHNASISVENGNGGKGGNGGNGGNGGDETWTNYIELIFGVPMIHPANGGSNGVGGSGGSCYNYTNFDAAFTTLNNPTAGTKGIDGVPGSKGIVRYNSGSTKTGSSGRLFVGSQKDGISKTIDTLPIIIIF